MPDGTATTISVPTNTISVNDDGHLTITDPSVISALKDKGVTPTNTAGVGVGIIITKQAE